MKATEAEEACGNSRVAGAVALTRLPLLAAPNRRRASRLTVRSVCWLRMQTGATLWTPGDSHLRESLHSLRVRD